VRGHIGSRQLACPPSSERFRPLHPVLGKRATVALAKKLARYTNNGRKQSPAEMEAVGHVAKDGKRAPPSPSRAAPQIGTGNIIPALPD